MRRFASFDKVAPIRVPTNRGKSFSLSRTFSNINYFYSINNLLFNSTIILNNVSYLNFYGSSYSNTPTQNQFSGLFSAFCYNPSTSKYIATQGTSGTLLIEADDGGINGPINWVSGIVFSNPINKYTVCDGSNFWMVTNNGVAKGTSASTMQNFNLNFSSRFYLVGDIATNGSIAVLIVSDGTFFYLYYTNSSLTSATIVTNINSNFQNNANSIVYGNGVFVAAGGTSGIDLVYSYDGINWNLANKLGSTATVYQVCFSNGIFAATGYGDIVYLSYDGISWAIANVSPIGPTPTVGARGINLTSGFINLWLNNNQVYSSP